MDFGWLKRLMPRGLYGRAALILFLPVVVVSVVVTIMFLQRHFEDVTRQMTDTMVRELALVADRVGGQTPEALASAQGIAAPLEIELTVPAEPVQDRREFIDFSGRVVIARLREQLPAVTGVDLSDLREVRVSMAGDPPLLMEFSRRRVSAANPHQLLVLLLGTSLLMTGIAAIFLRNQLRPIQRLARAAEAFGRGRIVPYRPAGAAEVRSAGAAFLDMRNRLERQNEQRKLMLSGVGHDLRTPLTRLKLSLSMLSSDLPPEPSEIEDMERDVAEMKRLVDGFLDHARHDAMDSAALPQPALPFVQGVVGDARRAGQNVTLARLEGDARAEATFRTDMLRRAVENLIGNAVRYGTRAEVEAAIGTKSFRISVEDDGPGIPAARREEAVRPFTRLDPARNQDRGGGVGLGLSIAADVARAHGGQLRLGDGKRFGGLRAEIVIPR
ncbi:two-component sensor histidine kinase [Paracoccus sp. Z118]|uniref:ATP-binding protein n=1 Tax=Paracoccus sp. Z118 TaxID=2851017 RepID=UPI001C2B9695|nr:ATP-binding protein [Paracoccus sp. Z118]MBV0890518.1 two-component sensor histidine kinase [Paracoccus sp. Z118]